MSLQDAISLISPVVIVLGAMAVAARWLWAHFQRHMDEGRMLLLGRLDVIEAQVRQINGTVQAQQHRVDKLEGAVFSLEHPKE